MALVYHFCNKKYGLENIKECRLKVATINDLNDPFEMSCYSTDDKSVRQHMRQAKDAAHEAMGILCFSRSFNSAVQWAHYGDKHKGLCLGFEIPDPLLIPVVYQAKRQGFDMAAYTEMDKQQRWLYLRNQLMYKHSHWRYEQESRLIFHLDDDEKYGDFYFKSFGGVLQLKQVIVGCASDITREEVLGALVDEFSDIEMFKVRPAFKRYQIVRNRDEKLWV